MRCSAERSPSSVASPGTMCMSWYLSAASVPTPRLTRRCQPSCCLCEGMHGAKQPSWAAATAAQALVWLGQRLRACSADAHPASGHASQLPPGPTIPPPHAHLSASSSLAADWPGSKISRLVSGGLPPGCCHRSMPMMVLQDECMQHGGGVWYVVKHGQMQECSSIVDRQSSTAPHPVAINWHTHWQHSTHQNNAGNWARRPALHAHATATAAHLECP